MDYGYSNTSYGAQGGANGGGFVPGGSQNESGGAKRSYGKDTLRPVTIKQLLDATHAHADAEHPTIDGTEASQITIVGQVRNIAQLATNVTYTIDDGTGTIEVKVWVDTDAMNNPEDPSNSKPKPVEQGYARVWGRLKAFNSKRHVGAQTIRPVTDYNEVSYHLLEATAVHLHFTRGPPDSLQNKQPANGGAGGHGQQNGNQGAGNVPSTLSSAATKVLECIRGTPQTQEGLHVNDIAMRTSLELSKVLQAGEDLQNHGMIYTTVDEHTWALLDI